MPLKGTHRCLLKSSPTEGYQLVEQPIPSVGPQDVLIRVEKVGICGSDINMWKWNDVARAIATLPFIPGHEATGEVIEIGSEVSNISLGAKVAVENHFFCGQCFVCKDGRPDICQRMDQYGHGRGSDQGGCSQYSVVPAHYCYVLTRHLTPNQACVLEPMGVAHNAVSQIEVAGQSVLVLGAGAVGLFAVAICKALGSSKIVCADLSPKRLETAKKMGADILINTVEEDIGDRIMKLTNGDGVGRIVEATGSSSLLNSCFSWLRKGGQMTLIGLPKAALQVEEPITNIIQKSLTLKTVHGRRIFSTWRACESLIASGRVDPSPVISHDLPMSRYEEGFQKLISGEGCKILLDPHE